MITAVPTASISAQRIVLYEYLDGARRGGQTSDKSRNNLKDNATNGHVSASAQKRIRAAVNWLYAMSDERRGWVESLQKYVRFRLAFITLTLPSKQLHCDRTIKAKCLNPFLERLRKRHGMKSYIWKAEAQENGNIHFHLTTNVFMDKEAVRKDWIECVNHLGYVDRYYAKGRTKEPPCTEIKAVKRVKNLAAYLAKYLTKESDIRPICGRQWFLSSNLSALKPAQVVRCSALSQEIEIFQHNSKAKYNVGEWATVIFADIFSSNLSNLPLLNEVKNDLLTRYKHTLN